MGEQVKQKYTPPTKAAPAVPAAAPAPTPAAADVGSILSVQPRTGTQQKYTPPNPQTRLHLTVDTPSGVPGVQTVGTGQLLNRNIAKLGPQATTDQMVALSRDTALADEAAAQKVGGLLTKAKAVGSLADQAARAVLPDAAVDWVENDNPFTVSRGLGLFDLPRAYSWYTAAEAGSLLPDSDTDAGKYLQGAAGDLFASAVTNGMSSSDVLGVGDKLWRALEENTVGVKLPEGEGDATAYHAALAEVGRRLYAGLADGTIAKRAADHVAEVDYGGAHPSQLTGRDILDIAVPKEDAKRLALAAKDEGEKTLWTALSTDVGREALGAAAEMVLDPLWFTGAAEGSKVVTAGGRLMRASESAVADAAAAVRHLETAAKQAGKVPQDMEVLLLSRLADDAKNGTDTARALLETAKAEAEAAAAAALAAGKGKNAARFAEDARRTERLLGEMSAKTLGTRIVEEGGVKLHVPGSAATHYLTKNPVLHEAQALVGRSPLGRYLLAPASAKWRELDAKRFDILHGKLPDTAMTAGEKMAWYAIMAAKAPVELPMFAWDMLGRLMGTRAFHAAYLPASGEAVRSAEKAGRRLGSSAALGLARHITAADPQNWHNYLEAINNAVVRVNARDQEVMRGVKRIFEEAAKVASHRLNARGGAGAVLGAKLREIWKGRLYDAGHIVNEVWDHVGRGTGQEARFLAEHPDLDKVVAEVKTVYEEIAKAAGVSPAQARQALQNMQRNMAGDFEKFRRVADTLRSVFPEIDLHGDPTGARSKLDAIIEEAKKARAAAEQAQKSWDDTVRVAKEARAKANKAAQEARTADDAARAARDAAAAADGAASDAERAAAEAEAEAARKAAEEAAARAGAKAAEDAAAAAGVSAGLDEATAKAAAVKLAAAIAKRDDYSKALKFAASGKAFQATDLAPYGAGWLHKMLADGLLRTEAGGFYRIHPEVMDALRGRPYTRYAGSTAAGSAAAAAEAAARTARAAADAAEKAARDAAGRAGQARRDARAAADAARAANARAKQAARAAAGAPGKAAQTAQEAADAEAKAAALGDKPDAEGAKAAVSALEALRSEADDAVANRPQLPRWNGELRDLHQWEYNLQSAYLDAIQKYAPDRPDLPLQAVFLVLRDETKLPSDIPGGPHIPTPHGGVEGWKSDYKDILGQRLGKLAAEEQDLAPIMAMTRDFIDRYEQMYADGGASHFLKSPLDRLRAWGVVDYVPHMLDQEQALLRGKVTSAMGGRTFGGAGLDAPLSTAFDAQRRRKLVGTLAELNSNFDDPRGLKYAVAPEALVARYQQAVRAVGARDFLRGIIDTGVAKSFSYRDVPDNYVPLFHSNDKGRAYDILVDIALGRIDGADAQTALKGLAEMGRGAPLRDVDPFASWLYDSPEIRRGQLIERMIAEVNRAALEAGTAPFVLPAKGLTAEWDAVAQQLNDAYLQVVRVGQPVEGLDAFKATGAWLEQYVKDPLYRYYVPADVYQNALDAFDVTSEVAKGPIGTIKRGSDVISGFVKQRLTIINTAFHMRNLVWNNFNNILDLGVLGALSPKTQWMGAKLTWAFTYVAKYGSLAEAERVLNAARATGEGPLEYAKRQLDAHAFRLTADYIKDGVDLGDGVTLDAGKAFRLLEEEGVITGAYTELNDLFQYNDALAGLMSAGGPANAWRSFCKAAGVAEDQALLVFRAIVGGSSGPTGALLGVASGVGKETGGKIAQGIENYSRLVNFVGNMRRTGSFADSVAHVRKYLFDYSDLSGFQQVWMRSLFQFYSWNVKNLALMADIAVNDPVTFSNLNKMLVTSGPAMLRAWDAEQRAQEGKAPRLLRHDVPERLLYEQEMGRVRLPVPGRDNVYITSLGSNIEGAIDEVNAAAALLHGDPRLLAQATATIRIVAEWVMHRSFFYGRDYNELTSGRVPAQVLTGIEAAREQAASMGQDSLAAALNYMKFSIAHLLGFEERWGPDGPMPIISSFGKTNPAFLMANLPWRPIINNASAMSNAYHLALQDESAGGPASSEPVPLPWRVADAMLGISLTQIDEYRRADKVLRERDAKAAELWKIRGDVVEYDKVRAPK